MSITIDEIYVAIYKAIDTANILLLENEQLQKNKKTILFGLGGGLDSHGLVSFVLDVEEILHGDSGINIIISDEKAMAQERSPFKTVESLASFIEWLIKDEREF